MKMIQSTLKLTLILYLCVAISGIYALTASARITPHDGGDDTTLITIEKGDTLWDLCQEHLKDPLKWRELSKYNDFTNPDLIYPGEKLRIPIAMAKDMEEEANEEARDAQRKLDEANDQLKDVEEKLAKSEENLADLKKQLDEAVKKSEALAKELKAQDKLINDAVGKSADSVTSTLKKELASVQEEIQQRITQNNRRINGLKDEISKQNTVLEATQKQLTTINQSIEGLLKKIEMNQQALAELKVLINEAKGVHEDISKPKRTLVFLTTVAVGIGWFAINLIGGRSGE